MKIQFLVRNFTPKEKNNLRHGKHTQYLFDLICIKVTLELFWNLTYRVITGTSFIFPICMWCAVHVQGSITLAFIKRTTTNFWHICYWLVGVGPIPCSTFQFCTYPPPSISWECINPTLGSYLLPYLLWPQKVLLGFIKDFYQMRSWICLFADIFSFGRVTISVSCCFTKSKAT